MAFLTQYALFLAEWATIIGVVALVGTIAARTRLRRGSRGHLEIRRLNAEHDKTLRAFDENPKSPGETALRTRKPKFRWWRGRAPASPPEPSRPRLFVLDFEGDIAARATDGLRREVTAVLGTYRAGDGVLLRLESGGGAMHAYGFAAAQLVRLRTAGVPLTVAVDKVAASGGYMMAAVADRLVAGPFAIVGSIGVVAQLPNFHRLLKKNDIDVELHTAGAYKRTLTVLGENTEAGREKFRAELEEAHALFREFVAEMRPRADLARAATGEHWFGRQALTLGLVDELNVSDDLIFQAFATHEVLHLAAPNGRARPWPARLFGRLLGRLAGAPGDTAPATTPVGLPFA